MTKLQMKEGYLPSSEAVGYERLNKHPKSSKYGRQNPITEGWNSDEQLVRWRQAWADSSDFGVPQNRVRLYILGIKGATPKMSLVTNLGAADSHQFKQNMSQESLFDLIDDAKSWPKLTVKDILEDNVPEKYYVSETFEQQLIEAIGDLNKLLLNR